MTLQTATFQSILQISENISILGQPNTVSTSAGLSEQVQNLTQALTTPKDAVAQVTLGGSTGSVDLTAITTVLGETVTISGKKPLYLKVMAAATNNAAGLTIAPGASNPYALFGAKPAGKTDAPYIVLLPGQSYLINLTTGVPAVGSGAKILDLAGTTADVISFALVAA